ncbi:aminoglycoside phosphotransferase family protein [bacterium]|nr:aminoglycoside phosphotransferase family protein [bacterium]
MAKETRLEMMEPAKPATLLLQLAKNHFKSKEIDFRLLKGDGSDRKIYLINSVSSSLDSVVGVYHDNLEENRDFIFLTHKMKEAGIPVPEVIEIAASEKAYLIQYLGKHTLAESIEIWKKNSDEHKILLAYKNVLNYLHQIQTGLTPLLTDFLRIRKLGITNLIADLTYFKTDFIERFSFPELFSERVEQELKNSLIEKLSKYTPSVFVYRDFQSRNIMWYHNSPWFIDYQSAFFGTIHYDLASLLYASKSGLNDTAREELLNYYHGHIRSPLSLEEFENEFYLWVLLRRLRSLGAYGFLSQVKAKPGFYDSIYPTLQELIDLISEKRALKDFTNTLDMVKQIAFKWRKIKSEDVSSQTWKGV